MELYQTFQIFHVLIFYLGVREWFVHAISFTAACLCLGQKSIWFNYLLVLLGCCCSITRVWVNTFDSLRETLIDLIQFFGLVRSMIHWISPPLFPAYSICHSLGPGPSHSFRAETQRSNSEGAAAVTLVSVSWESNSACLTGLPSMNQTLKKFIPKHLFILLLNTNINSFSSMLVTFSWFSTLPAKCVTMFKSWLLALPFCSLIQGRLCTIGLPVLPTSCLWCVRRQY